MWFILYVVVFVIIIYTMTICFKINKRRERENHAAILQNATRRKLSLRTDNLTPPIKRPIISPHRLTKSATFKRVSSNEESFHI